MRILFVASEGLPFVKTGGLADVIEALPKALIEMGHDVAVFMPRYRGIAARPMVLKSLTLPMGSSLRFPSIVGGPSQAGRHFFLDDPEYFDRAQLYGEDGDYPDNAERFAELARAALEFSKLVWMPEVIHCHDWQSALVPVLLQTLYRDDPAFRAVPVVFTAHNMGYHGDFPGEALRRIGLPETLFRTDALEYYGKVDFLKGGLLYSDYLTTVSPTYAQEIQTPEYGGGLDGVVRQRADRLVGVLNGVDYSIWDPSTDKRIAANYTARSRAGKSVCKRDLLAEFGLPENLDRPLIAMVSRLVDQKGVDLLLDAAAALLKEDMALVVLGTGEAQYEESFRELARLHPAKVAVKIEYDETLAHKAYAGADIFLMPSRYEPCGLSQMYSLRYGTVPLVRSTGGLADSVEPFAPATGGGTGFSFLDYTAEALLAALREALRVYRDKPVWRALQANGMSQDFSWQRAAAEYARLYQVARKTRNRSAAATSN